MEGEKEPSPPEKPKKDPSSFNLVEAAQYGVLERCRELVERGKADVMKPDTEGITCLHWAAINNRLPVARCVCVCVWVWVWMWMCVRVCVCCGWVSVCVGEVVCVCVCVCVCGYVCMHLCLCLCVCVCIHLYNIHIVCIHIHYLNNSDSLNIPICTAKYLLTNDCLEKAEQWGF